MILLDRPSSWQCCKFTFRILPCTRFYVSWMILCPSLISVLMMTVIICICCKHWEVRCCDCTVSRASGLNPTGCIRSTPKSQYCCEIFLGKSCSRHCVSVTRLCNLMPVWRRDGNSRLWVEESGVHNIDCLLAASARPWNGDDRCSRSSQSCETVTSTGWGPA